MAKTFVLNKALDKFKGQCMGEKASVALLFYVDEEGKNVKLKQVGGTSETVVTLQFLKKEFIDEVLENIIKKYSKSVNKEVA